MADGRPHFEPWQSMSNRGRCSWIALILGAFIAVVILIAAAAAGWYLGERQAAQELQQERQHRKQDRAASPAQEEPPQAPVYFFAEMPDNADLQAFRDEVRMASAAGIHRYAVPIWPSWEEGAAGSHELEALNAVQDIDPLARFLVLLSVDPPTTWLEQHPEAAVSSDGERRSLASLASPEWREAAKGAIDRALSAVDGKFDVDGWVLQGLTDGQWRRNGGPDTSTANTKAFREWLRSQYDSDQALRDAWGESHVTLAEAPVPSVAPDGEVPGLLTPPGDQATIDYRLFLSAITAHSIEELTGHLKSRAGAPTLVCVPYGYTFDLAPSSGHFGLHELLDGSVDGFIGPVSYHDRGIGGSGGFMGPVHSALERDKSWLLVDDTRTGVAQAGQEESRLHGLRSDDVRRVQERNFGAAMANDMGICWADPGGSGNLLDSQMWTSLGAMNEAYEGRLQQPEGPDDFDPPVVISLVVDERSRAYERESDIFGANLLLEARDAASRAGVRVNCVLLDDLLSGMVAMTPVCIFLNAFYLSEDDRQHLHAMLESSQATAIWLYAPGCFGGTATLAEGIGATTGLTVRQQEEPASSGSVFLLDAKFIHEGESFGESRVWNPLFYIEEDGGDDVTVLAHFRETERASIAVRFMPEGWTSVYLAEPTLTPALLRQLLMILEIPVLLMCPEDIAPDVSHFGHNLIVLHAQEETGRDRALELPAPFHIQDLLNAKIGWPDKQLLRFSMRFGETRILGLQPAQEPGSSDDSQPPES